MTLEEVKAFLEENAEDESVKDFRKSLQPQPDLNSLMQNEDIKKKLQSYVDAEASRQVETFKTKTLPDIIDQQVKAKMEAAQHKEPWEIQMEELKRENQKIQEALKQEQLGKLLEANKNKALSMLTEKKLPTAMIDHLVTTEPEKTQHNVETFIKTMEDYTNSVKQSMVKGNNVQVPSGDGSSTVGEPGPNATKEDWKEYYKQSSD